MCVALIKYVLPSCYVYCLVELVLSCWTGIVLLKCVLPCLNVCCLVVMCVDLLRCVLTCWDVCWLVEMCVHVLLSLKCAVMDTRVELKWALWINWKRLKPFFYCHGGFVWTPQPSTSSFLCVIRKYLNICKCKHYINEVHVARRNSWGAGLCCWIRPVEASI